ncbi:PAS domain-containing sensor histidine kinase [Bdellovibrio bacteriovorus]|uniref:histidine kinase n=1 Tax=Bdellovibrio bacteriovorus TaxID=959 RepID=A0A161QFH4_BDEBC|nr:PAS domain-containing protein [Bdellovibrio bacteriovorus]KYG64195.1 PAS domain-containing sensor histidine kinase [Bdellovibrio bacteriovorus]
MDTKSPKEQATLLEQIHRTMSDSVYIFDVNEENLVWINERGVARYGYTLEEIRKMGPEYYTRTMHPEDIDSLRQSVKKSKDLKDGEVLNVEYRFKDHSGNYHWLSDRITVFSRNEKGEVATLLGVATEIDARKAYEETLKKTIQKLNLSLSAANMGTWEWELEKNVLLWDSQMYRIHGIPNNPDLSPLEEVWKRSNRADMEVVNMRVREAAEKHQDFYVTYRITWENKEVHHIRCYGKFMADDASRMYGVAWDSTEEVLTEQQIAEAKAKLISATKMAALGEMSGGIAHEINNPLTVIQARAFQLQQMVENNKLEPEKIKQSAESISRTADKIARIIKSLRSFAREGSHDPFEIVPVKKIVEETLEFCRTRFYNHGVEVEVPDIDPELEVECRIIQIEQVLLNLLNNSFDAISQLDEKWIRMDVKETEDAVEFYIIDSGKGIPEEIAEQIMLPFFTTKDVGKGTGLGLSISAGIIKNHQGHLSLNKDAMNTTFVFILPKTQE